MESHWTCYFGIILTPVPCACVFGVQVDHGGERLVRYRCQNNSKVASPMRFHQVPSFVMNKDEIQGKTMNHDNPKGIPIHESL